MAACSFTKLTACSSLLQKCCLRWKECTQNGLLNSSCVVSGMGSYFFDLLQRTLLKTQCKLCEDYEARLHFVFVHKISFCICLCVRTILQTNMRFELFSAWTEKALNPNPTSQLYAYMLSACSRCRTLLRMAGFRIESFGFFLQRSQQYLDPSEKGSPDWGAIKSLIH